MMKYLYYYHWHYAVLVILLCSCSFVPDNWEIEMDGCGVISTPIAVDLNRDGILDLVMGGAGPEFKTTEFGVLALDGRDGTSLWTVPARNQVVGTAQIMDISDDGTPDIFIGGRSAIFLCINGFTGEVIWEFLPDHDQLDLVNDTTLLNFYTPQFIEDLSGDGIKDILVSFGGYVSASADDQDRPAGKLMILNSATGRTIREWTMPDGKETYMSPTLTRLSQNHDLAVIFGSGGETIGGTLYIVPLEDLLAHGIQAATILATDKNKGFIASPAIVDITGDNILDIIACSISGATTAIDGATHKVIWTQRPQYEGYNVYCGPVAGQFNDDDSWDFFVSLGHGPLINNRSAIHQKIDGSNGQIISVDTSGIHQYAQPVVYDFNQDGRDDITLTINTRRPIPRSDFPAPFYLNDLLVINGANNEKRLLRAHRMGSNLGATPLITDLDKDGMIDIISCYLNDGEQFYSFKKSVVERIEIDNAYMPEPKH